MSRRRGGPIRYHHLRGDRFFGFGKGPLDGGGQGWIAEPEKALLDWLYLAVLRGERPALDEVRWDRLRPARLAAGARKLPRGVRALLPAAPVR